MKTMCPPGYHHNGFVATHPLGHMMYDIYTYIIFLCCFATTSSLFFITFTESVMKRSCAML